MSTNPRTLELRIESLEDWRDDIMSKSTQPVDGESTTSYDDDTLIPIQNVSENVKFIKRSDFLSAVLGGIRQIDNNPANSEVTAIGQIAIGTKTGINEGKMFIGYVIYYPPTQDSHINFLYRTF